MYAATKECQGNYPETMYNVNDEEYDPNINKDPNLPEYIPTPIVRQDMTWSLIMIDVPIYSNSCYEGLEKEFENSSIRSGGILPDPRLGNCSTKSVLSSRKSSQKENLFNSSVFDNSPHSNTSLTVGTMKNVMELVDSLKIPNKISSLQSSIDQSSNYSYYTSEENATLHENIKINKAKVRVPKSLWTATMLSLQKEQKEILPEFLKHKKRCKGNRACDGDCISKEVRRLKKDFKFHQYSLSKELVNIYSRKELSDMYFQELNINTPKDTVN